MKIFTILRVGVKKTIWVHTGGLLLRHKTLNKYHLNCVFSTLFEEISVSGIEVEGSVVTLDRREQGLAF